MCVPISDRMSEKVELSLLLQEIVHKNYVKLLKNLWAKFSSYCGALAVYKSVSEIRICPFLIILFVLRVSFFESLNAGKS